LDADPSQVAAYNGQCSTFSLFDPRLGGGIRSLTATDGTNTIHATADEVNGIQVDDATYPSTPPRNQYRNIGRVNLTSRPPYRRPAARINISIANAADGKPISGILQTGTGLNITFSSSLTVEGATINGATYSVSRSRPTLPATAYSLPPERPELSLQCWQYSGLNTVVATAIDPFNPNVAVTANRSFLVVAAGGSNTGVTACAGSVQSCTLPCSRRHDSENNATSVPTAFFRRSRSVNR